MTTMTAEVDTTRYVAALGDTVAALKTPRKPLDAAAAAVAQLAGPRTPRRTGRLAGSVSVRVEGDRGLAVWGVGYAVYVNYGTRTMRAQPFATDAIDAAEGAVEGVFHDWLVDIT
jgi:HK97 gp10 family phage protein